MSETLRDLRRRVLTWRIHRAEDEVWAAQDEFFWAETFRRSHSPGERRRAKNRVERAEKRLDALKARLDGTGER